MRGWGGQARRKPTPRPLLAHNTIRRLPTRHDDCELERRPRPEEARVRQEEVPQLRQETVIRDDQELNVRVRVC